MKKIRYVFEAAITRIGLWFFTLFSPKKAGDIAAKIAQFVGKKISVQHLAYNNLSKALPALSADEKEKILDDMWDNLGRIVGEFPHVCATDISEIENICEISLETRDNILALKNSGKGGIIFSGHIGNWEVGPKCLMAYGINVSTVYRPLNNPYVEEMTGKIRGVDMIGKNSAGNRRIIEVIKNGGFVIILADQKITEGERVKFFHETAATTTSIARIVLKYGISLVPARVIRLGKDFKFRVEVEKPLVIQKTADLNSDILLLTREINRKLEEWISQYPAQWFWVHNRWKK
jgi:KDO2-lipid IV(A) lauroyltransferase